MDEYGAETVQSLHFFYDAQSRPAFVEYNGTKYRYLQNLQGDIVEIVDGNGNLVVEYKYDVWGKPISTSGSMADTLGKQNPFRYRGYAYDEETELYYLRSRYFNPEIVRFINTDSKGPFASRGIIKNIYAYCCNNTVRRVDCDGCTDADVHVGFVYFLRHPLEGYLSGNIEEIDGHEHDAVCITGHMAIAIDDVVLSYGPDHGVSLAENLSGTPARVTVIRGEKNLQQFAYDYGYPEIWFDNTTPIQADIANTARNEILSMVKEQVFRDRDGYYNGYSSKKYSQYSAIKSNCVFFSVILGQLYGITSTELTFKTFFPCSWVEKFNSRMRKITSYNYRHKK